MSVHEEIVRELDESEAERLFVEKRWTDGTALAKARAELHERALERQITTAASTTGIVILALLDFGTSRIATITVPATAAAATTLSKRGCPKRGSSSTKRRRVWPAVAKDRF